MKKEIDLIPKTGALINVYFRKGTGKIIGQFHRKICLIVKETQETSPRKREVWNCEVINSFPNVIDICPIKNIGRYTKGKKFIKTETIFPKKRNRIQSQKIVIEKI
jgi:hypothetical protein